MSKQFDASGARPAALFLSPEPPYPVVGGGPMRSASILQFLTQSHSVDVVVFREPGHPDPALAFPAGLVRDVFVIDLPFHSRQFHARAIRNLRRYANGIPPLVDRFSGFDHKIASALEGRRYQVCIIEHFWCASYGPIARRHSDRVILDLHNVESVLLARCGQAASWPESAILKRFAASCNRLESELLPVFSSLLVSSQTDADTLADISGGVNTIVCPNTIPLVPMPNGAKTHEIVFSGNLEYHPNISAVAHFHQRIWPLIRQEWPEVKWRLVGKNHDAMKRRFSSDPRIHVAGPVEDAIQALAPCQVAVAPLLSGSGTRIKIIEAWAAGLPVVSTSVGAEGLPGEHGEHFLLADEPEEFARAVGSVLRSQELRDRLGRNGRALYERELTWESAWRALGRVTMEV